MVEVRRKRTRAAAPKVVRRTRGELSTAGMDLEVPPSASAVSGYGKEERVEIILKISAFVIDGNLFRGDLENWVTEAVRQYHTFRHGHVGYGKLATVARFRFTRLDKLRGED